jgi:hypothetical protein
MLWFLIKGALVQVLSIERVINSIYLKPNPAGETWGQGIKPE